MPRMLKCLIDNTYYFAPESQWVLDFIARFFIVLHFSMKFFIYSLNGSEFRARLTFGARYRVSSQIQLQAIDIGKTFNS